ncbi:FAD-binding and (Fe-S)-binding domain-containing protein [Planctomycetaceae bacterium SH139]
MSIASTSSSDLFEQTLRQTIRGDLYFDPVNRGVYATDASLFQIVPQCVVVPRDAEDTIAAVKIAAQFGVPITARGGGTSLSGQTFGPGMVIDFSKYMDQVEEVYVAPDGHEGWARVGPGVVRDRLNKQVAPHGLHFAPDPATGSRATVGGMIGNNTCGTRSIVFGKTIDHVLSCRVVLADGSVCDFEPLADDQWKIRAGQADKQAAKGAQTTEPREAEIYRGVGALIERHRAEILARYPKVLRRVSGYNLDEFVDGAGYTGPIGPRAAANSGQRTWNLSNLIVGSEGTLALLLEAKIRLVPLPPATALCVVHFDDLIDSLRHVDRMLEFSPSTVELLDRTVMREAKVNEATRQMAHFISGDPHAVQIVEFFGQDAEEASQRVAQFAAAMKAEKIGYAWPIFTEPTGIQDVWETRKLGLGLISNVRGAMKGRDFIEDACVPTEHLAEYIGRIQTLCADHGIGRLSLYAHASVGVVHVVPALDLHDPAEVVKMEKIAHQAFEWVMEFGGSWSGEHGDGQVRGQFLPNMFGPDLYGAFVELKQLFDPQGLMNPGKVVDAQTLTENLRYQTPGYEQQAARAAAAANYRYQDQGGLKLAVEQCNGVGACRKLSAGTMCPSYMATRDEQHTTRGRANALRLAMTGQLGDDPVAALASDGVNDCLSLCLACKACKTECPNAVDMAKLKSDVLQMRHDRHGTPWSAKILGRMPDAARRLAGRLGRAANLSNLVPGGRRLLEKMTGIDRRRPLPTFATKTLEQHLSERQVSGLSSPRGEVVLFADTYANYFEPHIGLAALSLLEGLGYRVEVAQAGCCQRTRLSKGLVREAKQLGTQTLQNLKPFAERGLPILCLEPSCASALVDDLADLVDDQALGQLIAGKVQMIDVFLASEGVELASDHAQILLHGHCHQKALFGTAAIRQLFADMPATDCREVDSGCCGMAGSFGYENYDLSRTIGEDRLFPAVRDAASKGQTIVACGISCRHQLSDFLGVHAYHWVEVVRPKRESAKPNIH